MDLVKNNSFFCNWNNSIKVVVLIFLEVHYQFISSFNFWMVKMNFDLLDMNFGATRDNYFRVTPNKKFGDTMPNTKS